MIAFPEEFLPPGQNDDAVVLPGFDVFDFLVIDRPKVFVIAEDGFDSPGVPDPVVKRLDVEPGEEIPAEKGG